MNPWDQPGQRGQPGNYGPPPQQPAPYGQHGYQAPQPQQYLAYPAYPAYPGNTAPPASPSGGTAITAGVLALLGAVAQGVGAMSVFATLGSMSSAEWDKAREVLPGWWRPYVMISGFVEVALAVALLVGGILLLRRRDSARMVIATCCVVVIVAAIVGLLFTMDMKSTLEDNGYPGLLNTGKAIGSALAGTIFPLLTLVLVLVPSTKRWCQFREAGQPSGPAPYPGYR